MHACHTAKYSVQTCQEHLSWYDKLLHGENKTNYQTTISAFVCCQRVLLAIAKGYAAV
jgi:hypothetical protein